MEKDDYNLYNIIQHTREFFKELNGIDAGYIEQKFDEFFFQIFSNLILSDIQQMLLINFDRKLFVMMKNGKYFLI